MPSKYEDPTKLFPLYIDVHGGGYCIGEPCDDDEFCSAFCEHFGIIVASINYSKAPQNPFPAGLNDVVAIATSVIRDSSLRIDKDRVAIGGFSAGGGLALAACQSPELRALVKACCPFYPPTDLSIPPSEKLKLRPWREEDKGVDVLSGMAPIFNWAYIPTGSRLKDPKISPSYAERCDLPEWIFIVGAEYDMLCFEARALACKLGGLQIPSGREEMDDETGLEEKYRWERDEGKIRWLMARGMLHGFAQASFSKTTGAAEEERVESFQKIWTEVGEWLCEGPWA